MPSPETFTPYEAEMTRINRRNVPLVKHLKTVLDEAQGNPAYVVWEREGEACLVPIDENVVVTIYKAAREARLNLAKSKGATVAIEVFREANGLVFNQPQ